MTDSVKILVMGESGVGKSQLVNTLAGKTSHARLPATVGCAVTVIPHLYRSASPQERLVLVELWDIGGSAAHRRASRVFVDGASAVILVHDLSNKQSESNLVQWLSLLHSPESTPTHRPLLGDIESLGMPALIVGCKQDQAGERARQSNLGGRVQLNATQPVPPGSTNRVVFSRYFDLAIDRLYAPAVSDRRRRV